MPSDAAATELAGAERRADELLTQATEQVRRALELYEKAAEVSEPGGESLLHLRQTPSARLFRDGVLMDDPKGWAHNREADPLRQLQEDMDDLMSTAALAQEQLVARVGPALGDGEAGMGTISAELIGLCPKPRFCRRALFAFNPGVKAKEAAEAKAAACYGPSEGKRRRRNLMDLARVSLVFPESSSLRAGLSDVLEHFVVADVRNYYHQGIKTCLGQKFIEVLVVLKEDLPVPFICEIRLEELAYFNARQSSEVHLRAACGAFREMYANCSRLDLDAVDRLARCSLTSPSECHKVRTFRRRLARRFGSVVSAWRRRFGAKRCLEFVEFRDFCTCVMAHGDASALWQELDCSRGGCISLFELDPAAVCLLARFRERVLSRVGSASGSDLLARFVGPRKLASRMSISLQEFRSFAKELGFESVQCENLFWSMSSNTDLASSFGARSSDSDVIVGQIVERDFQFLVHKLPKTVGLAFALLELPPDDSDAMTSCTTPRAEAAASPEAWFRSPSSLSLVSGRLPSGRTPEQRAGFDLAVHAADACTPQGLLASPPKSPRSPRSPRSSKSPRSAASPRTPRSPRGRATWVLQGRISPPQR